MLLTIHNSVKKKHLCLAVFVFYCIRMTKTGVFRIMVSLKKSLIELINEINIEDLQYVETDLCFYELVALGFLLYGDDRSRAQFILQRLIILSQHPPQGKGLGKNQKLETSDILRKYANFNRQTWRLHIVEALAIIRAKRVLRRLGLTWRDIDYHFLPHVAEISVHIHPLLKALYIITERLTPEKTARLINEVNTRLIGSQNLRFYDFSVLEIFLLNWLSKSIIKIESEQLLDCDVEILIEYFKHNDMLEMKDILLEALNQNARNYGQTENTRNVKGEKISYANCKDSGQSVSQKTFSNYSLRAKSSKVNNTKNQNEYEISERYSISRENAGYVLILNQVHFYKETDPKLQHLLPSLQDDIPIRKGTNVDRDKLKELFTSFGYIPLVFENLTHLEILHKIRETAQKSLHKDSLIVCILSHGMEGVVFGSNTIPVSINEIKEIFTTDSLKGKPKMLIIQACQRNISNVDTKSSTCIRDFAFADILLAMSSIPGTDALRHTQNGSWFVDSLYKNTQMFADRKHMLDILTAVTCDISKRKGEANQVMLPSTSSTMRKDFYLPSSV